MSGEITVNAPAGDPGALLALADQLDKQADGVGDLGANLGKTTSGIRSAADWSGTAAESYTTFTGATAQDVSGFESPLHNVANAIRGFAGVLKSAQQRVADAVHTASTAAGAGAPNAAAQVTAAQQTASDAQSDVDQAADKAADEIGEQKSAFDEFIEKIEPIAKANDWAHLPLDLSASDLWLDDKLEDWAKSAEKGLKSAKAARTDLDATLKQAFDDEVGSVAHDFDNGLASMEDVESAFGKYSDEATTAIQAADATVDSAQGSVNVARAFGVASKTMGGLAIAGDVFTIIKPEDSGTMGTVDRVAAGANIAGTATALLAANASADWIPGVGEVVAAGSGLYLAGDALYHIKPIHDFVNKAGSVVAGAAKSAWHSFTSLF